MSYFKYALCVLVLLLAAACGSASTSNGGSGQTASTPIPTPFAIQSDKLPKDSSGTPMVAQVNGSEITLPEYERMMQRYLAQPISNPTGLPKVILQTMIQQELIDQAAAQNNIVVTDAQVTQEMQGLINDAGGQDKWKTWLQANNYTEDELRSTLRDTLLTSEMRDRITGDLSGAVPQVHARHILVSTQDQANQLLVQLRNGVDFAKLAQQYSLDTTTSVNGGDLGWFTQEELLEPALSQVAFQLQPGQVAGPIQTSLGWDIIETLERATKPVDPGKRAELAQTRFENWLNTLTATAKIQTYL